MSDKDFPENSTEVPTGLPQDPRELNRSGMAETQTPTSESSTSPSPDPQLISYSIKSVAGPLPDPEMLRDFDRVLPGLAREIVDRADREMQHRHQLETNALGAKVADRAADRNQSKRGQWMGFVLALSFLAAGLFLTLNGHPAVGGTIATTTVVSLVAIFVTGRVTVPSGQYPPSEES